MNFKEFFTGTPVEQQAAERIEKLSQIDIETQSESRRIRHGSDIQHVRRLRWRQWSPAIAAIAIATALSATCALTSEPTRERPTRSSSR